MSNVNAVTVMKISLILRP